MAKKRAQSKKKIPKNFVPTLGVDESDEDDDEFLLKPSLICRSSSSPPIPEITNVVSQDSPSHSENSLRDSETLMKRAQATAESYILSFLQSSKITDCDSLRWYIEKKYDRVWPVYLPVARVQKQQALLHKLKLNTRTVVVRHLGRTSTFAQDFESVALSRLKPFDFDSTKHTWNQAYLNRFIEQLRVNAPTSFPKPIPGCSQEGEPDVDFLLMVEQCCIEMLPRLIAKSDHVSSNKRKSDDSSLSEASDSEDTHVVTPPSKNRETNDEVVAPLKRKRKKQQLRAGDIVEYINPVISSENGFATIVKVLPKSNGICLYLSNQMRFNDMCSVRLAQRRLKGRLVDNQESFFQSVGDYILKPSEIDDVWSERASEKLHQVLGSMQDETSTLFNQAYRKD